VEQGRNPADFFETIILPLANQEIGVPGDSRAATLFQTVTENFGYFFLLKFLFLKRMGKF